jgi:hypothetical protein
MSRHTQENVFAGILFLFFLAMLVESFNYGPRARLVPVPISILCLVLLTFQIVWQNLRPSQDLQVDALELITGQSKKAAKAQQTETQEKAQMRGEGDEADAAAIAWRQFSRSEFAALGIVLLFLSLFLVFGPIPAAFLFSACYFMFTRHWSPIISFLNAALFSGILYFLFGYILGIQLNVGVLSPYIYQFVNF